MSRVTFKETVRIPGVLLPAGTYDFKGSDNQNTVLVSGRDGRIIAAVPARAITMSAAGSTFTLQRSASDKSLEVVNWRADGTHGFEFLYPAAQASEQAPVLAKRDAPPTP
jgi:hypothetical protein